MMMKDLGLISKLPRIVVAQAERANPLYRSYLKNFKTFEPVQAQKTLASAIQIGNPVSIQKAIRTLKQFNGIVEQATEEELANAAALGDRTGMFNCPHTGVALAVLIKLLKAGKIDKSERVVVISTAHGLKFVEMKVKYHQRELDFPCRHVNQPIELPARLDAVKDALQKALKQKGADSMSSGKTCPDRNPAYSASGDPPRWPSTAGAGAARRTTRCPRPSSTPRTTASTPRPKSSSS